MPRDREQQQDRSNSGTDPQSSDAAALSPNEVGRELGISGVAVKQWIYQRQLPATKMPNGYSKIARRDLNEFLRDRKDGGRRRVLLLGKNAIALGDDLQARGWRPLMAENQIDAILRAVDNRPTMAVIDMTSLGNNGWSAAKKLRATRAVGRIPILLIIDNAMEADPKVMDRSISIGAQRCLKVPVTAEAIVRVAEDLVGA